MTQQRHILIYACLTAVVVCWACACHAQPREIPLRKSYSPYGLAPALKAIAENIENHAARLGLAHSIEEWEASNRAARLAPGTYTITKPIELRSGESLIGSGHNTVLVADPAMHDEKNPPAIITNADYALVDSEKRSWTCHDTPMHIQVRDLAIVGNGDVNDYPTRWNQGRPDKLHGIRLNAPGSTISNVLVYDIAGQAIAVKRWNKAKQGETRLYDITKTTITDCMVHKCYRGVSAGGADCCVHNLVCAAIRDEGLHAGAACNVTLYHGWGCGVGLWTKGGTCYCGIIQTENCAVGWKNDSPLPTIQFWRAFANTRLGEFSQPAIALETNIDGNRDIEGKKLWPNRAAYVEAMR